MLGRLKSLILDRIYKRINRAVWQPLGGQKPIDYSQMAKFIASYESALFMLENLGGAKHFNSKDELLEFAISQANTPGLWLEFGVYKGGDIH